jgi:hypothetical protein
MKTISGTVERAGSYVRYGDTIFVLALGSGERISIPVSESDPCVAAVLGLVRNGDFVTLGFSEFDDEGLTITKYEAVTIDGASQPWATSDS